MHQVLGVEREEGVMDLPLSEYYLYCKSCRTYFDRWKYDTLDDSGHSSCKVRTVNGAEFLSMLSEDREQECMKEQFADSTIQRRGQRLYELASVLLRNKGYTVRGD